MDLEITQEPCCDRQDFADQAGIHHHCLKCLSLKLLRCVLRTSSHAERNGVNTHTDGRTHAHAPVVVQHSSPLRDAQPVDRCRVGRIPVPTSDMREQTHTRPDSSYGIYQTTPGKLPGVVCPRLVCQPYGRIWPGGHIRPVWLFNLAHQT